MVSYKLSKREKVLLIILAIVVVAIAWFMLVFQGTTNDIARLESEIASTDASIDVATSRVTQMEAMEEAIAEHKAEGSESTAIPNYDNLQPLMAELNTIMSATSTYTLTFDEVDRNSSPDFVYRGVRINFSCGSFAAAEAVIKALATGTFPCAIDSISIVDNGARNSASLRSDSTASSVSAYAHVTFFEKYGSNTTSTTQSSTSGTESASAASASASSAAAPPSQEPAPEPNQDAEEVPSEEDPSEGE